MRDENKTYKCFVECIHFGPCVFHRQDSAYVFVRGNTKKDESGPIQDNFDTLGEVTKAIKDAGIEKCGLILGNTL